VTHPAPPRIEIDGAPATAEQALALAMSAYGHFTAMQVRAGKVRGLAHHLRRLDRAHREVFGAGLDDAHLRSLLAHAVAGGPEDASVRVHVQMPAGADQPWISVIVRPPAPPMSDPWRLRSVPYQRSVAHVKHIGDFGQNYYGRMVERDGYDEALLTGPDGLVSEGSFTNVAFFDAGTVVFPAVPILRGITMTLIEEGLAARGVPVAYRHVRLADVPGYDGMLVTNSQGIAPVAELDGAAIPQSAEMLAHVLAAYDAAPWDDLQPGG